MRYVGPSTTTALIWRRDAPTMWQQNQRAWLLENRASKPKLSMGVVQCGKPKLVGMCSRVARAVELSDEEHSVVRNCQLLADQPIMFVANFREGTTKDGKALDGVRSVAELRGAELVEVCGKIEAESAVLSEKVRGQFLYDLGYEEPGPKESFRRATGCWACTHSLVPNPRRCERGHFPWEFAL